MKIAVVVFAADADPAEIADVVGAVRLFRPVLGVARDEDDGFFEVDVPRHQHESLWEAFRRLDIKFQEKP